VRIGLQVLFEPALIELGIVERRQARSQATESTDKSELCDDYVDNVSKLCCSCELESVLSLPLHVAERISGGEKKRYPTVPRIDRILEITCLLRRSEGASEQFETAAQGP